LSALNDPLLCTEQFDMVAKLANSHKCMKIYYKHIIHSTSYSNSCGHPQGGVLQRTDTSRYYKMTRGTNLMQQS